jgi:hypothetical protein
MRVFLVWIGTTPHRVHFEVLSYDRTTHTMKVKCKDGTVYDRIFDPNSKYNKLDYRLVTENDDA